MVPSAQKGSYGCEILCTVCEIGTICQLAPSVNWYHPSIGTICEKGVPSVNWYHLRNSLCRRGCIFGGRLLFSNPLSYLIIPPFFKYILIRIGAYTVLDITGALIRETALYIDPRVYNWRGYFNINCILYGVGTWIWRGFAS